MNINDEAVEAALKAWGVSGEVPRNIVSCVLTAAAPFIAAQALRDAAEELKEKRLLTKPFHEYYPEWLNKKADTYRSQA